MSSISGIPEDVRLLLDAIAFVVAAMLLPPIGMAAHDVWVWVRQKGKSYVDVLPIRRQHQRK